MSGQRGDLPSTYLMPIGSTFTLRTVLSQRTLLSFARFHPCKTTKNCRVSNWMLQHNIEKLNHEWGCIQRPCISRAMLFFSPLCCQGTFQVMLCYNNIKHVLPFSFTHWWSHNFTKTYLVKIPSDLKILQHCADEQQKIFLRVRLLFVCFYSLNINFWARKFKVYVRSALDYATQVWSPYLRWMWA